MADPTPDSVEVRRQLWSGICYLRCCPTVSSPFAVQNEKLVREIGLTLKLKRILYSFV